MRLWTTNWLTLDDIVLKLINTASSVWCFYSNKDSQFSNTNISLSYALNKMNRPSKTIIIQPKRKWCFEDWRSAKATTTLRNRVFSIEPSLYISSLLHAFTKNMTETRNIHFEMMFKHVWWNPFSSPDPISPMIGVYNGQHGVHQSVCRRKTVQSITLYPLRYL